MSCDISNLPNHILQFIFQKLPIATLVQCQYVCRSWQDILADPDFDKSRQEHTNPVFCLEWRQPHWVGDVKNHSYWLEFQGRRRHFDWATSSNTWNIRTKFLSGSLELINSCNGLLCVSEFRQQVQAEPCRLIMCIWNPITGEYMSLPSVIERPWRSKNRFCGLGFSSKTNQFKAVRLSFRSRYNNTMGAEVYTLGGIGTWRNIGFVEPFNRDLPDHETPIYSSNFAHGSFYWLVNKWRPTLLTQILAFDFDSEQFRSISLPPPFHGGERESYFSPSIGVFRDSLFFSCRKRDSHVEVWVMSNNDHGSAESWTRTFVLEISPSIHWASRFGGMGILENGHILLVYYNQMWLYNPRSKSFLKVLNKESKSVCGTIFHRPSFASLKDMVGDSATVHAS